MSMTLKAILRDLLRVLSAGLLLACGADSPAGSNPPPPPVTPLYDRIIFARYDPGSCSPCNLGIWTLAADGSDLRLLIDSLHWPEFPSVAPNGLSLVFEDWGTLYLANADGTGKRALDTGYEFNRRPSWTPDGEWIFFAAAAVRGLARYEVFKIRPAGTDRELVVSDPDYSVWDYTLSRDGRQIAFLARDTTTWQQWVVVRDLTTGVDRVVSDSAFPGSNPRWTPDASALLFLDVDPFWPSQWAFWRLDLTTLSYEYFGPSEGNRIADYSPDGRTLVFGTGGLWLADSSGRNSRVLLADGMVHFGAAWTPGGP